MNVRLLGLFMACGLSIPVAQAQMLHPGRWDISSSNMQVDGQQLPELQVMFGQLQNMLTPEQKAQAFEPFFTAKQKGNPDSWADVKQRLPLLSQKPWYSKLTYGYARGHEAYTYVENIRKYQISLVGYLQEKEKKATDEMAIAQAYPAVSADELNRNHYSLFSFIPSPNQNDAVSFLMSRHKK